MTDFTTGTVDVPAVGKVKKRYLAIPAGLAAVYVAYRWYASRQAAADAPQASDGTYSTPDTSEYGLSTTGGATNVTGNTGSVVTDGTAAGAIDDNAEWTQKAVERLGNQGYDGQVVTAALGEFLARRALDKSEATIARAALAMTGQPPVGGPFSVIEEAGTSTGTLAAPTGLKVTATSSGAVSLSWNPVDGAASYEVFRSGASANAIRAAGTTATVQGLQPNTTERFQVAAVGSTGKSGPRSAAVSGKTKAVTLTKPTGLKASAVTKSSFRVSCSPVSGATYYRWYVNGAASGASDQPYRDFTGLKSKTTYSITVAADTTTQSPSAGSAALRVKTK